ncbi:hypothetical protein G9A89_018978 [Geosiphon pyriformis]|nr:hypothetical protein G9A89_018978 [Geosiphon pyriformis]
MLHSLGEETESEQETEDSENEEEMASTYITKISEFTGEDSETSPQEWLDKVSKAGDANSWNAARILKAILYFLQKMAEQFTDNNTFITLQNWFQNIKQEPSESVMTYLGKFNKLLRRIWQLETNEYYSNAQILDQFIAGLKDKLIKKVCPHVSEDLATAIQQAKNYEMAMEEANCTKLVNLAIEETSSAVEKKIDQLIKKPALQPIQQQYQQPLTQHYQVPARRLIPQNQFTPQNQYQVNNNKINSNNQLVLQNSAQPKPNHYHTQPSYLMIPEEQNFHHTALLEDRAAVQQQNPSYTLITIPPARIAENANLSDIFSFEFEANELPFLLSNAVANEQKAITAIYTEAEAERKPICLILDSRSTGSIITYQLIQQLKKNVDQPAQTIIVTADGMKKTPVREINNFPFTIDRIPISVKVLVMDAPQYQALIRNDWLQKANANLNWETQELTISYQGQHAQVFSTYGTFNKCSEKALAFEFKLEEEKPIIETFMALGSTSNWADETEQQYFSTNNSLETKEPVTPGWNGHLVKRSGKWDGMPCLTYGEQLLDECNWIDVAFRERVCDQTCQYALLISEKVTKETPFDAAYNSALNKLYHYSHDAKMIFDLAMALINGATQENVCQMKESEYIAYTFKIAGYNYEDEVKVYHQIASHTYPTKKAQAQQLEQMNIKLCKEYIMPCDEQWCSECYALSILLPIENDKNKIEFGEPEATEEIEATPIYLIKNQPALQLKYFNNNEQGIKPKKAHEIDAKYDLRYSDKDTLVLKPKSLTKINLKIALEILLGAIVQIASQSSLASKGINVRGGIINAGYTGDITVILQNETNKPFKIEHAEKIAKVSIYP